MIDKFPKGGIQMMQDVHQIEVFRIPLHVELTELMEMKVTLKMHCVRLMFFRSFVQPNLVT